MKAVVINGYGDRNTLELIDSLAVPQPAPNQVLIKVAAAAINPLDWKIRRGDLRFIMPGRFPLVLGNDVSGTIEAVGADVREFAVGDDVFCMLDTSPKPSSRGFARSGGYAEYAVTRADTLCLKPAGLPHVEAAAVPLAALTAYQALVKIARIKSGRQILINGASGGVGTFAVQMAKAWGAEVTAVCSGPNHDLVKNLGADQVLDYRKTDFIATGRRYDVVFDVAANRSFREYRASLGQKGIFITTIPNLFSMTYRLVHPLMKAIGRGEAFRHVWVKPSGKDLDAIRQMIEGKSLRPVVGKVYPLEAVREAHAAGEGNTTFGKIVIHLQGQG